MLNRYKGIEINAGDEQEITLFGRRLMYERVGFYRVFPVDYPQFSCLPNFISCKNSFVCNTSRTVDVEIYLKLSMNNKIS